MTKHILILIITTIFASCAQDEINPEVTIDKKTLLLDVRTAEEFQAGHLKNAINIPYTEIADKIADHAKTKETKIVLYCRSGRRSGIAFKTLSKMGYINLTNAGSYKDLKK